MSTPKFSVLINGATSGFFSTSRGIRKGNPLSPFLFILISESLSQIIQREVRKGNILGLHPSSHASTCSHQQFVDDTLLMGESSVKEDNNFKKTLYTYEHGIGHKIS